MGREGERSSIQETLRLEAATHVQSAVVCVATVQHVHKVRGEISRPYKRRDTRMVSYACGDLGA